MLFQAAGHYTRIERYPTVHLTAARIAYKVDFAVTVSAAAQFYDFGQEYIEAKGAENERFRIVKRLWKFYGPGPLRIFKADGRGNPVEVEVIVPEGRA